MKNFSTYLVCTTLFAITTGVLAQTAAPITLNINAANVQINSKNTTCKNVTSKFFPADSKLELTTDDPACTGTVVIGVPPASGSDQIYQGTIWAVYEKRLTIPAVGAANPLLNINLFFTDGVAPVTSSLTARPPAATSTVYVKYKVEPYAENQTLTAARFGVDFAVPLLEGTLVFPGSVAPVGFSSILPVQQQIPITLLYNQQGNKGLKVTLQEINSGRNQPAKDRIVDNVLYIFKDDPSGTPLLVVPPVVVPPVIVPPSTSSLRQCTYTDNNGAPIPNTAGKLYHVCGTDNAAVTSLSSIPDPSWTTSLPYAAVTRQPLNAFQIPTTGTLCESATPPITTLFYHNIDYPNSRGGRDVYTLAPNTAMAWGITPTIPPGVLRTGSVSLNVSETFGPQAAQFVSISKSLCDFDTSKIASKDPCYFSDGTTTDALAYRVGGNPSPTESLVPVCVLKEGERYYINLRFQDARPTSSNSRTTGFPTQDSCSRTLVGRSESQCSTLVSIR